MGVYRGLGLVYLSGISRLKLGQQEVWRWFVITMLFESIFPVDLLRRHCKALSSLGIWHKTCSRGALYAPLKIVRVELVGHYAPKQYLRFLRINAE